jgi:hypothetical protein
MTDDIDRTDELLGLYAEDQRREAAPHNGHHPDDLGPQEPPPADDYHAGRDHDESSENNGPTTWEPVDLGPWLRGEAEHPEPALGIHRSDGLQLIYPGREHAVLGETESGKTWFALGCVAAELALGNHVVYIQYEEGDPASTIERLTLLDVDPTLISTQLLHRPRQGRPNRMDRSITRPRPNAGRSRRRQRSHVAARC